MKKFNLLTLFCLIVILQIPALSESYNDVIILNSKNIPVSIYKSITPKKDTFGVNYLNEIIKLNNMVYARCLYSANYGFEGDPVGYQIETQDHIKGWVALENVWFPAKVQKIKKNDVLNIRNKESANSDIADKLKDGETLYVNADYIINTMGYKGSDPTDWIPVVTKNKIIGYAKMFYVNIEIPDIRKFNK